MYDSHSALQPLSDQGLRDFLILLRSAYSQDPFNFDADPDPAPDPHWEKMGKNY